MIAPSKPAAPSGQQSAAPLGRAPFQRSQTWPPDAALLALPANHRRAVAALLRTVLSQLPELVGAGIVAASAADLQHLAFLAAALGPPPRRNLEGVRQALLAQLDDRTPRRLAAYGKITTEQSLMLHRLTVAVRGLLASPDQPQAPGEERC